MPITITVCVLLDSLCNGSLSFFEGSHLEVAGSILTAGE